MASDFGTPSILAISFGWPWDHWELLIAFTMKAVECGTPEGVVHGTLQMRALSACCACGAVLTSQQRWYRRRQSNSRSMQRANKGVATCRRLTWCAADARTPRTRQALLFSYWLPAMIGGAGQQHRACPFSVSVCHVTRSQA